MNHRHYIILAFMLAVQLQNLQAQLFCNDSAVILERKGVWQKGKDIFHDKEIGTTAKNEALRYSNRFFDLVKEAYPQGVGCEPKWYSSIERRKYDSPVTGGPQPYSFNSLYKKYICDRRASELFVEDATGTWLWIFVNQLTWMFEKSNIMTINGKEVQTYVMPTRAGELNGMSYYRLNSRDPLSKAFLFTRPNETLLTPVSRKEYLDWKIASLEKKLENGMEKIRQRKIRPAAEQEAEKNRQLQKISDQNARQSEERKNAAVNYFLKTYQTDEQRRDEALAHYKANAEKELQKYYDEQRQSSVETLQQPALFGGSKGIFSNEEKNGNWTIVTIRENYFQKNISPQAPQVIILIWEYNDKHIAGRYLNDELISKFPFDKLQKMVEHK